MIAELQAARTLNTAPTHLDVAALDPASFVDEPSHASDGATESSWKTRELLRRDHNVRQDLSALKSAKWPSRLWRAPLYRSYRIAAESGLRAALWFLIASTFFVWAGWPAASASLSSLAQFAALGAITPNPRGFSTIALVGAPIAAVMAGVLEFIVLDGADGFLVLAIALAPFTISAALLTTSQSPLWSGLGRINLVGIATILAPSNPQSYNPQIFLFTSVFLIAAAAVLLAAQTLVPPVSDHKQRMRLLTEAREASREADLNNNEAAEEATFRDASRIEQFLCAGGARDARALAELFSCFDQSEMVRLCNTKLMQLADVPFVPLVQKARAAIVAQDTEALRAVAHDLVDQTTHKDSIEGEVAECLLLASASIDRNRSTHPAREAS